MAESAQIQRMSHRHDAIIDFLIANPHVKNLELLCHHLQITRSWLSVVMRSDVFREEYTRRRMEHNQGLSASIIQHQLELTLKAMSKLDQALDEADLDPHLCLETIKAFTPTPGRAPQAAPAMSAKETDREFVIDRGVLVKARETIREIHTTPALPAPEGA